MIIHKEDKSFWAECTELPECVVLTKEREATILDAVNTRLFGHISATCPNKS